MAGLDCTGNAPATVVKDNAGVAAGDLTGATGNTGDAAVHFDGKMLVVLTLLGIDGNELKGSDMMKAAIIAGVADALTVFVEKVSISSIETNSEGILSVTLVVILEQTTAEKLEAKSNSVSSVGTAQLASNIKGAGEQLEIKGFSPGVSSITCEVDSTGDISDSSEAAAPANISDNDSIFVALLILGCIVFVVLCVACRRSDSSSSSTAMTASGTAKAGDATGQWLSDEPITKPNVSIL
jgi:hypothetical protein